MPSLQQTERENRMNRRTVWVTVGLIAAVAGLALLAGCGGGNSGPGVQTGITGTVMDVTSQLGIGNVVLTAGGQSATSSSSTATEGSFTLSGMSAGTFDVIVHSGAIFVPVPGPAPHVTVVKGKLTDVGTVWVIDRANLPPS
jgi:hypothetical protein